MFDFTNRLLYAGSIDWLTPQMLEIVAVGAIAITFEFRMPSRSNLLPERVPVQLLARINDHVAVAGRPEQLQRVDRQNTWLHSDPSYVE
jgi:hypothetical protein